jgi:hypothetical protein
MHIAKMQKLYVDLNDKLVKHSENMLSEHRLTGHILSTVGKEYNYFKDVWDTIPTSTQMVNLLIEKPCAVELQVDKLALAEAMALVAHENDKKKLNSMKVNSSKSMKRGADSTNRNYLATSANNLVTGLQSVLKGSSMQGTGGGKLAEKKNADACNGGFKNKQCSCGQLVL